MIHYSTFDIAISMLNVKKQGLAVVPGGDPVLVKHIDDMVYFESKGGVPIGRIAATQAMCYDGRIYTVYNSNMTENYFQQMNNKILHLTKEVSKVLESSTKLFPGVAVQDVLGICILSIPYKQGFCSNCRVKELDKHRIIDAKYENGIFMAISEFKNKYYRTILCLDDTAATYTCRQEADIDETHLNFTVLKNGVCIHIPSDDKIEIFRDNNKIKIVKEPPFKTDMRLINDSTSVYFINGSKLYSAKLK
jgi:hypothetical protein